MGMGGLQDEAMAFAQQKPLPHPEGLPYPYETKGWRDVGITAALAVEFCDMTGHPCLVMHNTTLIYKHIPEGWTTDLKLPMVCFNIWGDHGFFYQTSATNSICHKKIKLPKTLYSKKLSSPYDDDLRTDFKDMVELAADEDLLLAIDNGDKVDFWLQSSITHFKNLLEERKISFYPTYAEANFEELRMISIPVYKKPDAKKKKKKPEDQEEKEKIKHHIRIRLLPKEAPILDRACNIYNEKFGKTRLQR